MPRPFPVCLTLVAAGWTGVVLAAPGSTYTRHDFEACPVIREHETGRVHRCEGYRGAPVTFDADEHGLLVGIGRSGESATTDSLVARFEEAGGTIEWRGPMNGGAVQPIAAILRFRITTGPSISAPRRDVLAVYRLDPERSCIAAVIDARGPDANAQARRLADTLVPAFRCRWDKAMERLPSVVRDGNWR